jgi:hypothetical protein
MLQRGSIAKDLVRAIWSRVEEVLVEAFNCELLALEGTQMLSFNEVMSVDD